MTGEITLRGEVLPIGGVKEKVLAARAGEDHDDHPAPKMNRRDVTQITPRILHGMTFRYVESMDEVLAIALLPPHPRAPAPGAGRAPSRLRAEITSPPAPPRRAPHPGPVSQTAHHRAAGPPPPS